MHTSNIQQNASYRKLENEARIDQRVCLWCDWWMRSESAEHRKCNQCKGEKQGHGTRVGDRIRPVEGVKMSDPWTLDVLQPEEYYNVRHLGVGA